MTSYALNTINPTPIPTGGLIRLDITTQDPGTWTLTRHIVGQPTAVYVLFKGPAPITPAPDGTYYWINLDLGDGTSQPLDNTLTYYYTFTTTTAGTVTTDNLTCACSMTLEIDPYLPIMFRCFQAGLQSLAKSAGFSPPTVQIAMPLTGVPPLPIIAIAPALLQQTYTPIGHGYDWDYRLNRYQIYELVKRRYVISVHAKTPNERDFYTASCLLIFKGTLAQVLGSLGQNVSTDMMASYGQTVDDEFGPGMYFSEISLDFEGDFVASITTNYGIIESVAANVNDDEL
jgi:hypothetical protein